MVAAAFTSPHATQANSIVIVPHIHTVILVLLVAHFLRCRGRGLPWRKVIKRAPVEGDLRVEQCYDEELRRHVRYARILDPAAAPGRPGDAPTLIDVRLIAMSPQAFALARMER